MKFDLSKYSKASSIYSITYTPETSGIIKKDLTNPFSFVDFLKYFNFKTINNLDYINEYNQYLKNWYIIKQENSELTLKEIIKQSYITLLKEIQFNYLTSQEQNYLEFLDYTNPLELEAAIPYFVDKLKEIIIYYSNKRESSKRAIYKWNNKGSKVFIRNFIKDYILESFSQQNNIKYQTDFYNLSALTTDIKIEIEELYDYNNYYSESNIYDLNLNSFIQSIDNLSLSATEDYSGSEDKSNVYLERKIIQKFLASDQYLISAFETLSALDINLFINDTETVYSPYHIYAPAIALSSSTYNLKTGNYIGQLLHPKNQVASNYVCKDFYYVPDWDRLSLSSTNIVETTLSTFSVILTETISISGNPSFSLQNTLVPDIEFFSNSYLIPYEFIGNLKYNNANGGLANKPLIDNTLKRFFPYQSIQDKTGIYNSGLSRPSDSLDYWNKDIWKNVDVYNETTNNILNRATRENDLLYLNNKTLTKYQSDIFGNSYGVYKDRYVEIDIEGLLGLTLTDSELSAWGLNWETFTIPVSSVPELSVYDVNTDSILSFDEIPNESKGLFGFETEIDNIVNYVLSAFELDSLYSDYSLSAFNISNISYLTNNSPLLQTELTNPESLYKIEQSPYEKHNNYGTLYVNNLYKTYTSPLTAVISENIDSDKLIDLHSNVVDIDILYDFFLIKTKNYYFYGKINFNYTTGNISFNSLQNFNIPIETNALNKTSASVILPNSQDAYICSIFTNQYNLSALDSTLSSTLGYSSSAYGDQICFIPVIYNLNSKNTQYKISYNGYLNISEFLGYTHAFIPKEISTPQLSYNEFNKTLVVTIFGKDICENNIIFIYTFDAKYTDLELLSTRVITPDKLYITSDILSHSLSGGPLLSGYFDQIAESLLSSFECAYEIDTGYLYIDEQIFSNDKVHTTYNINDGLNYETLPYLQYNLDTIYDYLNDSSYYVPTSTSWGLSATSVPLSSMGFSALSAQDILGPCDIVFNFGFLNTLYATNIVSSIYKIEVAYDDTVIVIENDLTTSGDSPLNYGGMSPINREFTKRFYTNNNDTIKTYNLGLSCYCFESPYLLELNMNFNVKPANVQQYFSNMELLNTMTYTLSGTNYHDIYIETKNPQYILKNTIEI